MSNGYVIPVDPSQIAARFSSPDDDIDQEEVENVADDEGVAAFLSEQDYENRIAPLLDRIPRREADLIYLYFIQKKKQADIAEIFEVTQAAISYRLDRGLRRIKFLLSIPHVTEEDMRRDLARKYEAIDINILVGMWQTTCQSDVAKNLNLTQGRVRHRFFNAVRSLERYAGEDATFAPYHKIFSSIANKNFNVLKAVVLPQWQSRGIDKCF